MVSVATASPASGLETPRHAVEAESDTPIAADVEAGGPTATDEPKVVAAATDEPKVDAAATAQSASSSGSVVTKDGNKAVPAAVKIGVDANKATTTTSPEPKTAPKPKTSPLKSLRDQVKSTLNKLGVSERAGHNASRSGSGASTNSGSNGGSDS
jgi:hypothetical protein